MTLLSINANDLLQWLRGPHNLEYWEHVAKLFGSICAGIVVTFTRIVPWFVSKLKSRRLRAILGDSSFPLHSIENALRFYITPECQDIDPARAEEPRAVFGVRQNLFEALDNAVRNPSEYRYMILLADSGMGKTSALINYFARHRLKWMFPTKMCLLSLTAADATKKISGIADKTNTTLLLDALDEDICAISDHHKRIKEILESTSEFPRVIVTCRTQFFSRDEEIPHETGILKIGPRSAGEAAHYRFHKIYLAPFSDQQVNRYLRRRYPWYKWRRRILAKRVVRQIQNLAVRPMLLSHIDDLLDRRDVLHGTASLYEAMIAAWLRREEGLSGPSDKLLKFSERLSMELYCARQARGGEYLFKDDLAILANKWGIEIDPWKLSGRSLLNRDAAGHFKFAHRSVLEYLFVRGIIKGRLECFAVEWTDQMNVFLSEMLFATEETIESFLTSLASNWKRPNVSTRVREFLVRILLDGRLAREVLRDGHDKISRYLALWISWLRADSEFAAGAAFATEDRSTVAGDKMLVEFRMPDGGARVSEHDDGIRMLVAKYDYLGLRKINTQIVRTSRIRREGELISLYLLGGFGLMDGRYLRITIEGKAKEAVARMQHVAKLWNRQADSSTSDDANAEFFFMDQRPRAKRHL